MYKTCGSVKLLNSSVKHQKDGERRRTMLLCVCAASAHQIGFPPVLSLSIDRGGEEIRKERIRKQKRDVAGFLPRWLAELLLLSLSLLLLLHTPPADVGCFRQKLITKGYTTSHVYRRITLDGYEGERRRKKKGPGGAVTLIHSLVCASAIEVFVVACKRGWLAKARVKTNLLDACNPLAVCVLRRCTTCSSSTH